MLTQLAQIVLLAAEEEPEGVDLIIPEVEELVAGIVAFALVFFVVWKWGVPAINRMLAARQEAITSQLTDAEKAKSEAESLLSDYRSQLADAKDEANRIVDDARRSAESVRAEIVARAESDAGDITRKAREEAVAAKERAAVEIRDEVASLSLELAQKVVAGSVDSEAQRALVDRYIEDLGRMEG